MLRRYRRSICCKSYVDVLQGLPQFCLCDSYVVVPVVRKCLVHVVENWPRHVLTPFHWSMLCGLCISARLLRVISTWRSTELLLYFYVEHRTLLFIVRLLRQRWSTTCWGQKSEGRDENVSTSVVELWAIGRRHYQGITNCDDRSKSRTSVTSRACNELWWYQQSNILLSQCGENGR